MPGGSARLRMAPEGQMYYALELAGVCAAVFLLSHIRGRWKGNRRRLHCSSRCWWCCRRRARFSDTQDEEGPSRLAPTLKPPKGRPTQKQEQRQKKKQKQTQKHKQTPPKSKRKPQSLAANTARRQRPSVAGAEACRVSAGAAAAAVPIVVGDELSGMQWEIEDSDWVKVGEKRPKTARQHACQYTPASRYRAQPATSCAKSTFPAKPAKQQALKPVAQLAPASPVKAAAAAAAVATVAAATTEPVVQAGSEGEAGSSGGLVLSLDQLPQLSATQHAAVVWLWSAGGDWAAKPNDPAGYWLNDEVVNGALGFLAAAAGGAGPDGVFCFSTFFYTRLLDGKGGYDFSGVKRWTRKVDIFAQWLTLFPLNHGNNHWSLAALAGNEDDGFTLYHLDSLASGLRSRGVERQVHSKLRRYLEDEWSDKKGGSNGGKARVKPTMLPSLTCVSARQIAGLPQQKDESSCGVYVLGYAYLLLALFDSLPPLPRPPIGAASERSTDQFRAWIAAALVGAPVWAPTQCGVSGPM